MEFEPGAFWGFDPNAAETAAEFDWEYWAVERGCDVHIDSRAAWVHDGTIRWFSDGLNSKVGDHPHWKKVGCFDLAKFVKNLADTPTGIILKIDAEGSEYTLLEHLIQKGADKLIDMAWVEWHCLSCFRGGGGHREDCKDQSAGAVARATIGEQIACELREWGW
jgi:hypothetical protein